MSHGGPQAGSPHVDSSCLLTPPSTPLGLEPIAPDWPEPDSTCGKALLEAGRNGLSGFEGPPLEGEAHPQAHAYTPVPRPCWRLGRSPRVIPPTVLVARLAGLLSTYLLFFTCIPGHWKGMRPRQWGPPGGLRVLFHPG